MNKKDLKKWQDTLRSLKKDLVDDYLRLKIIYEKGSNDPNWEDGTNFNLKVNHIHYGKRQLESLLKDDYLNYPDVYYYPDPSAVANDFMAVPRALKARSNDILPASEKIPYRAYLSVDWGAILSRKSEQVYAN